jgi:hypothetical protein
MRDKLNEIRIPELVLENLTLVEAIETLVIRSSDFSPTGGGFGYVIRYPKIQGFPEEGVQC